MADTQVDVVVVGLGVGGEEVAGRLAEAGLSTVGVEASLVGGECPYWGCIPSKMMIRAGNLLAESRRVDGMAGHTEVSPDWAPVARRIRDEATDGWDDKVAVDRFTGKGGRFVRGMATLLGDGRVEVGGETFQARRGVVMATGTSPAIPNIPGLHGTPLWTNRELVETEHLPTSLLVLGGGAIGVELAQALARFGVAVTIVEAAERILPAEEPEAAAAVHEALLEDGIVVETGRSAVSVAYDHGFALTLDDGRVLNGEKLLVSVGRRASLAGLGIDNVGLDPTAPSIAADDRMRAGPGLWAVGDVTGRGAFTHVAMYQADVAVRDILDQGGASADYRALPRVTFTDPELGSVGLTEARARAVGIDVHVGIAQVPATARGWLHKTGNTGVIKLVADPEQGVLVGATAAGPTGGEVLAMLTLAVHEQTPIARLRQMIYAYPTFHRGVEDALRNLK